MMRRLSVSGSLMLAVLAFGTVALPPPAHADFFDVSIGFDLFGPPAPVALAPPPMPIYVVPSPPDEGYIWSPGHWRWDGYGYFWVPGTWVMPPLVGLLWTPGYWGWGGNAFGWHEGYWDHHVGFYGGINYGGGYNGSGFSGGRWNGPHYIVNRSVVNVTNITNVTNVTNTVSYNGGTGGTQAVPNARELSVARETHVPITQEQMAHARAAAANPALSAANNHGRPEIASTTRAGDFTHNVMPARAAGAVNPAAEKHNAALMANPALAHGAALPHARAAAAAPAPAQQEPTHANAAPAEHAEGVPAHFERPFPTPAHPVARTVETHNPLPRYEEPATEESRPPQHTHPFPVPARQGPLQSYEHHAAPAAEAHPQAAHAAPEHAPQEHGEPGHPQGQHEDGNQRHE